MMSCADLRGAFERLVRYLLILSDALTRSISEERAGYRVIFVLFGGDRPVPHQRIEFILVTLIGFCRWISGREVHPLGIELPYPPPADPAPYGAAFRCPVSFDAPRNSVLFARADMTAPLPTSNPLLAELHERFAGEYLKHFDHAHTSYRAREVIIRRLPDGEPRRDQVAGELRMSERTLQRRLEAEATSFIQLLDTTRRELAEQYLGRLHLSLAQAAYLLGFADQSSFFRACKRWFALSPGGNLVCPTHPLPSTGSSDCADDDGGSRGIPPHGRMTTPAAKAARSSSGILFIRARPLRSEPVTQVVRVVDVQIGLSRCSRSGSIMAGRRDGHNGGPGVRIGKHA